MKLLFAPLLSLIALALAQSAEPTATAPAPPTTAPQQGPALTIEVVPAAGPTSAPTTQPIDPRVDEALDRLETAGERYTRITAAIEYQLYEPVFDTRETRTGQVFYQKDPAGEDPTKFRIQFLTLREGADAPTLRDETDYVFDGLHFISRKARIREFRRWQVARPGEADPTNALELGRGPFPVPFGQRKADVLRLFEVSTTPPAEGADPNAPASYLRLVPRPNQAEPMNIREIEMWIDRTGLPRRIRTVDREGSQTTTVTFTEVRTNAEAQIEPRTFDLPHPPPDWDYRYEPLPQRPPASQPVSD